MTAPTTRTGWTQDTGRDAVAGWRPDGDGLTAGRRLQESDHVPG